MPSKSATPQRCFGEVVRECRTKLGISQEELAHRSDLSTTIMSEAERGKKAVSILTIVKIAKGLGTTGGELMTKAGLRPASAPL